MTINHSRNSVLFHLLAIFRGDKSPYLNLSGFQLTVEKPKPKQLLRPITTGTNSSINQSQLLAITCNSPEAREISRVYGAIGFGFASHWLKIWRESFKPITKRSNRNHVITFGSHSKLLYTWCIALNLARL